MPEKGFKTFRITGVRGDYLAQAYRFALSNMTGAGAVMPNDDQTIISAAVHLQEHWRARAMALRKERWATLQSPSALVYAMNCPPIGVFTNKPHLRRCGNYWVCPFCWCQHQVKEAFDRCAPIVERSQEWDIIEVITTRKYPVREWAPEAIYEWVKTSKQRYLRTYLPNAAGGYVLCTIEPPGTDADEERKFWVLRHRVLALVTPTSKTPPEEIVSEEGVPTSRKIRRQAGLTKDHLVGSLGRICMYPRNMLAGGAGETVRLLELRAPTMVRRGGEVKRRGGVRMTGFYGMLRKRTCPSYSPE